jgi:hypothetical protein
MNRLKFSSEQFSKHPDVVGQSCRHSGRALPPLYTPYRFSSTFPSEEKAHLKFLYSHQRPDDHVELRPERLTESHAVQRLRNLEARQRLCPLAPLSPPDDAAGSSAERAEKRSVQSGSGEGVQSGSGARGGECGRKRERARECAPCQAPPRAALFPRSLPALRSAPSRPFVPPPRSPCTLHAAPSPPALSPSDGTCACGRSRESCGVGAARLRHDRCGNRA